MKRKEYLRNCLEKLKVFLAEELHLELNSKTQIFPVKNGVDYPGFHTYLTETGRVIRKLCRKPKAAMKRKIKHFNKSYAEGEMTYEQVRQSAASWIGHAKHGNTYYLRKNILRKLKLRKDGN